MRPDVRADRARGRGARRAASLLEVFALASADPLKIRRATLALRGHADLRRSAILSDPKRREVAARLYLALRAFLAQHPGEIGLARQRLAKLSGEIDA